MKMIKQKWKAERRAGMKKEKETKGEKSYNEREREGELETPMKGREPP